MICSNPMPLKQESGEIITVPCGRCMPCRVNHAQEWALRIETEMKDCYSAYFITLTYDDAQIPRNDLGNGILHKPDLQKFFKRLRYYADQYYKTQMENLGFNQTLKVPSIRYYAVGEYGEETYRPHYHAIVFNIPTETIKYLERIWQHGFVKIGTVTPKSIRYVTKYITKWDSRDLDTKELIKPFNVMSKGIGANYVNEESREYHSRKQSLYTINKKYKQRIGKYLENKIHDTDEKKARVAYHKKRNAAIAKQELLAEEAKLREQGVDLYKHYENKRESQEQLFIKNNKRNKL